MKHTSYLTRTLYTIALVLFVGLMMTPMTVILWHSDWRLHTSFFFFGLMLAAMMSSIRDWYGVSPSQEEDVLLLEDPIKEEEET